LKFNDCNIIYNDLLNYDNFISKIGSKLFLEKDKELAYNFDENFYDKIQLKINEKQGKKVLNIESFTLA
jgi:hypothetical protein